MFRSLRAASSILLRKTTTTKTTTTITTTTMKKSTTTINPSSSSITLLSPPPTKANSDGKQYRAMRLPNGMKVLLISDTRYPLEKLAEEEKMIKTKEDNKMEEGGGDGRKAVAASDDEDEDMSGDDGEEGEEEEEEEGEGSEDEEADDDDDVQDVHHPHKKQSHSSGLKQSAAGLCIGMGSFADPPELPGLAHFLEHMVFMGSQKYPDENSFDDFIQKSGGSDNASTDCERTVFYFETQRKFFREGLDRFAQFFISPLMKKDTMTREREAIDSEFEIALPSDYFRKQQIFGSLAKPDHPMGKFMWGNLKSLQKEGLSDDDVHAMLHAFKSLHYTSQSMTLAIQSQEELDTLQAWVEESFAEVTNDAGGGEAGGGGGGDSGKGTTRPSYPLDPFSTPSFARLYKVVPVQNVYQLDLQWSLPPLRERYREKPLHYLCWVIGHEGKGSLVSYLRKKVWALSLTAGNSGEGFDWNSTHTSFAVSVVLTQAGFDHLAHVVQAVFSYLEMMRREGPSRRIFDEIKLIADLDFEHGDEVQPSENVESLCENMQLYPPEMYLTGDELMFEFDPELIQECLSRLARDNVNLTVLAKEYADCCRLTEPWFGTKYSVEDVPPEWVKDVGVLPGMHLPDPNKFIAEDTSLKKPIVQDSPYPARIVDEEQGELFFKADTSFAQPRAHYVFHLCGPALQKSLETAVALDLMVNCICLSMVEDTYAADQAQLQFTLHVGERGLLLKCSGLNDKLQLLLEEILNHITAFVNNRETKVVSEESFRAVRDQTKKVYYNGFIKPMKLVKEARLSVLQDPYFKLTSKHSLISSLTLDSVVSFSRELMLSSSGVFLQGLVQGNVTEGEARAAYELVKSKLKLQPVPAGQMPEIRCNQLPFGDNILRLESLNAKDGNTVVTNYYQGLPGTLKDYSILELLISLMEEPVFDTLRTREQLGYSVFCMLRNTYGVLGISVTVCAQASKFTGSHVDSRIDKFLHYFLADKLRGMPEEEFRDCLHTLVKQKKAADVTLEEEVTRNWVEILAREYRFDRLAKDIENLESFATKELVMSTLSDLIQGEQKFKKISVQVIGNSADDKIDSELAREEEKNPDGIFSLKIVKGKEEEGDEKDKLILDCQDFKNKLKTYPVIRIAE